MITAADLEELDRTCCALDEARPRAVVTAHAWGLGMNLDRQGGSVSSVPISSGASLAGPSGAARVIACAAPVSPPADECQRQPATILPADVSFPAGGKLSGPALSITGPVPLCVWCAMERAFSGQGPAPRFNGDVYLKPCPRHEERTVNPNANVVPAYPKGRW